MGIFYHGTSVENAISILQNGFGSDSTIWYASDSRYIYMRKAVPPEAGEDTYNLTIHSAFTTAAVSNSQESGVAIFRISIPDSLADCVEPDDSVEYDENSYQIEADRLNRLIADGSVKVECRVLEGYIPELRSFVLAYTNLKQINMPDAIKEEIHDLTYGFIKDLAVSVFDWVDSKYAAWSSLKPLVLHKQTNYFGG